MRAGRGGAIGVGAAGGPAGPGPRRVAGRSGFSLGAGAPAAASSTALAAPAPESLLALQAAGAPEPPAAAASVRAAALGHAELILEDLAALQHGLLAADPAVGGGSAALERLARRVDAAPGDGADPALAELLDAVALRAAIELARRGWRGGEEAPRQGAPRAGDGLAPGA